MKIIGLVRTNGHAGFPTLGGCDSMLVLDVHLDLRDSFRGLMQATTMDIDQILSNSRTGNALGKVEIDQ